MVDNSEQQQQQKKPQKCCDPLGGRILGARIFGTALVKAVGVRWVMTFVEGK